MKRPVKISPKMLLLSLCLLAAMPAVTQTGLLQEAVSTDRYQPVGLAISRRGRMFVSFPKWSDVYQYGVVEVAKDSTRRPFPNENWNRQNPRVSINRLPLPAIVGASKPHQGGFGWLKREVRLYSGAVPATVRFNTNRVFLHKPLGNREGQARRNEPGDLPASHTRHTLTEDGQGA